MTTVDEMDSAASVASSPAAPTPPAAARERFVVRLRLPRAWTAEEDASLQCLAMENGFAHWHRVARQMPPGGAGAARSARSCRDRWRHHLARDVYHRPFTARDDEELRRLVERFGGRGRWKDVARGVYGRTSRVMKRRWKVIRGKQQAAPKKSGRCPSAAAPLDDEDQDVEVAQLAGEPALLQQGPSNYYFADEVLPSSFASCSLAVDSDMDPRAGSLALGFACMAV